MDKQLTAEELLKWTLGLLNSISNSKTKSKLVPEAATLSVNIEEYLSQPKQVVYVPCRAEESSADYFVTGLKTWIKPMESYASQSESLIETVLKNEIERLREALQEKADIIFEMGGKIRSYESSSTPVEQSNTLQLPEDWEITFEKTVNEAADKYGFQVPYDGSNKFYNDTIVESYLDGAKFALDWIKANLLSKGNVISQAPISVEQDNLAKASAKLSMSTVGKLLNKNMKRQNVYKAIDSEREYQEKEIANPDRPDMIEELSVGDTLTAIKYNLDLAVQLWYRGSNPHQQTMEYLRKIAGLCVQAGEKYGMPERKMINKNQEVQASNTTETGSSNEDGSEDAIGFVKWIYRKGYTTGLVSAIVDEGYCFYHQTDKGGHNPFSAEELYELYKQQQP